MHTVFNIENISKKFLMEVVSDIYTKLFLCVEMDIASLCGISASHI